MGCVGSAVVNSEAASGKAPCVNTEKQNKFNLGGGEGILLKCFWSGPVFKMFWMLILGFFIGIAKHTLLFIYAFYLIPLLP